MKSIQYLMITAGLLASLSACQPTTPTPSATAETTATADTASLSAEAEPVLDTVNAQSIKAKFVEFTLGDASHYSFEDEKGEVWDFAGSDDKTYEFGLELPEQEANEENQGWGSDKKLQGKWFELTYIYRNQPLYQDGPVSTVPVILTAKLVN